MTDTTNTPDVDACIEEAFTRLYAKIDSLSPPVPASQLAEQQAMAIIKTLASELMEAGKALEQVAETLKMQPALYHQTPQSVRLRLQLANRTILASRRAREAAESVLG